MTGAFDRSVAALLSKYQDSTLAKRWKEAISFGRGVQADAFWFRESEDVVNIVWLNADGIRDITLTPSNGNTIFNFLPLKHIVTFEVREAPDVASRYPLGVIGHLIVHLVPSSVQGHLFWVASTDQEEEELYSFLMAVATAYAKATNS